MDYNVLLRKEPFGGLIIHVPTGRELYINKTAYNCLNIFLKNIEDYQSIAHNLYPDMEIEILQHDYETLTRTFIHWVNGNDIKTQREETRLNDYLSVPLLSPKEIFWEVTWNCNSQCLYCYNNSGKTEINELTSEECYSLIKCWKEIGVYKVIMGGGEPFTRKDIIDILHMLERASIVTVLVTNGTLLNEGIVKQLSGLKHLRLAISLDGHNKEINDSIRVCNNGFDNIIKGISFLNKYKVPFSIQTVLTKINKDYLEELAALVLELEANSWSLKRLLSFGRAKNYSIDLTDKEIISVIQKLDKIKERFPAGFFDYGSVIPMAFAQNREYSKVDYQASYSDKITCGAAYVNCGLTPDGKIIACSYMNRDEWLGPSVRDMDFIQMWNKAENLNKFRSLNAGKLSDKCIQCSFFRKECHGGCRANAYNATGDWLSFDPACPYA